MELDWELKMQRTLVRAHKLQEFVVNAKKEEDEDDDLEEDDDDSDFDYDDDEDM